MTTLLILNLSATADPNNDMLGLIIFGFDFVIFALILTAIINRAANKNAAKLWPKLAPVINGTFHKGIGLTAPYIIGNYHGLPVRARIRVSARSRWNYEYYFEILATSATRGQDWELRYNQGSHEAHGWELKTKDPALQERLSQAGLKTMPHDWERRASLKYHSRKGTLLYSNQIFTRDGVPTPEVFEMQLEMLKKLVNINQQANKES
jgi:hypothetical protein